MSTPGSGRRGTTVFMPPVGSQQSKGALREHGPDRRIVAVMITYSWNPGGEVFPVRRGRTLIGRGEECDIRLLEDPALSHVHSYITFDTDFVLRDMISLSGTDLNGAPLNQQVKRLPNFARIRTGSTQWVFVIIDPDLIAHGH
jgi:hypothetical protein